MKRLADRFENYEDQRVRLKAVVDGATRALWDVEARLYLGS